MPIHTYMYMHNQQTTSHLKNRPTCRCLICKVTHCAGCTCGSIMRWTRASCPHQTCGSSVKTEILGENSHKVQLCTYLDIPGSSEDGNILLTEIVKDFLLLVEHWHLKWTKRDYMISSYCRTSIKGFLGNKDTLFRTLHQAPTLYSPQPEIKITH